jgi:hypothetical protein
MGPYSIALSDEIIIDAAVWVGNDGGIAYPLTQT